MSFYNYATFDLSREEAPFARFADGLHAGEPAPEFSLEDLGSGRMVPMGELWASGPAVLEFGSFT